MTTEDDFQNALDANREDWQTRLVFADWLDDRSDTRGPGYRALGLLRRHTDRWTTTDDCDHMYWELPQGSVHEWVCLPSDWWHLLPRSAQCAGAKHRANALRRREAEDAAALAFAKLPARRQAELLAPPAGAPVSGVAIVPPAGTVRNRKRRRG